MKYIRRFSAVLFLCLSSQVLAEAAPQSVVKLAETLKPWGADTVLINAVKSQNASGLSLDQIKTRDSKWQATEGVDKEMKAMMESAAAKRLLEMEKTAPFYFELFLMDNQGANVAMTNKTSDYWQGDEAKWKKSFNNGVGAVHIGKVKFDDSAQAYLVQVSIPVMEAGKAIGAITIGINLDELEAQ